MDMSFAYTLSTVLVVVCFSAICWWAFNSASRKGFEEAANIPFDDEDLPARRAAPSDAKQG